ncbi:hypothetical protein SL053_002466 [Flavobacterium psychrophilum]|nr:hypothetical protein [Flavobacterium psychrophilum]
MKYIITFLFLTTLTNITFGQDNRVELANSNIFYTASYKDKVNQNKTISVREFQKDTIINNLKFKKYKLLTFIDIEKSKKETFYYETFENDNYIKLDNKLKPIHSVNYKQIEQTGTIFNKKENIKLEYVDTRNSFPRDSLQPNEKTPKKFYSKENPKIHFVLSTDLKINQLEIKDTIYTKQLLGENVLTISNNFEKNKQTSNKVNLTIGDEIQLFYRRRWYNDTTGNAEFENKQFKNLKYIKDSISDGNKVMIFSTSGYNYLSGNEEQEKLLNCIVKDTAYYLENYAIPIENFKTEMKILHDNSIFLQTVSDKKIGETNFPIITQYNSSSPYKNYVLPYFPFSFVEAGNIEGFISYLKLNGKEYGTKSVRTYITDKTNIRTIKHLSENEVEIAFYLFEKSKIEIQISENENAKTILKKELPKGEHKYKLKTDKLKAKNYYNINFNYETKDSSGSISNGFETK